MDLVLMLNKDEKNKITKTPETIVTLTGSLKNATSILNINVQISGYNVTAEQLFSSNYLYIPVLKRYYFITDIEVVTNNLYTISARVDVLKTYENYILAQTAIVSRQENNWNLYLNDGSFKVYQNPYVITKEFPSGFDGDSYVLAIAGG